MGQPKVAARVAALRFDERRRLAVGGHAVEELRWIGAALQGDRVVDHNRIEALAVLDLANECVAEEPEGGVCSERNRIISVRANPAGLTLKVGIPFGGGRSRGLRTDAG